MSRSKNSSPISLAQQVLVFASGLGNNASGGLVTKRLVLTLLRRVGVRVATASVAKYVLVLSSVHAAGISFGA